MKRRKFLGLAATGAAGLVVPATARVADAYASALPRPSLLAILHDERVVREIGWRYREMTPAENNPSVLAEAILGEQVPTSAALGARLEQQVKGDFVAGRTVTVNGWILSLTEARQCALFSLQRA